MVGIELVQRRRCFQHRRFLVLGQAHAVDVVQVEKIHLECVIIVFALGSDGGKDSVQALAHLLCVHIGLRVCDHTDARRTGRPRLVVDLIEIRVACRLGELIHTVSGIHHLPVEIAPCLCGFLLPGLTHLYGVIRDHVLRIPDAILPAGEEIALVGKQLGNFVQILAGHLLRRTLGRRLLLLDPPQLKVIQLVRKGIGIRGEHVFVPCQRVQVVAAVSLLLHCFRYRDRFPSHLCIQCVDLFYQPGDPIRLTGLPISRRPFLICGQSWHLQRSRRPRHILSAVLHTLHIDTCSALWYTCRISGYAISEEDVGCMTPLCRRLRVRFLYTGNLFWFNIVGNILRILPRSFINDLYLDVCIVRDSVDIKACTQCVKAIYLRSSFSVTIAFCPIASIYGFFQIIHKQEPL